MTEKLVIRTWRYYFIYCESVKIFPHHVVRLNGSYEALERGNIADALVDFTGGVCESTNLQETGFTEDEEGRLVYFKAMQKAMCEGSLVGASITVGHVSENYS